MTDISSVYDNLARVALAEFDDVIVSSELILLPSDEPHKLRLSVIDGSLVDIWLSVTGRYSYHWERRVIKGDLFRHDNAPHVRWRHLTTFPKHFHDGANDTAVESHISDDPETAIREFLTFVRHTLLDEWRPTG